MQKSNQRVWTVSQTSNSQLFISRHTDSEIQINWKKTNGKIFQIVNLRKLERLFSKVRQNRFYIYSRDNEGLIMKVVYP